MKQTNFDRLRIIIEENQHHARQMKDIPKAEAFGKVLDEMIDLEKKYPKED